MYGYEEDRKYRTVKRIKIRSLGGGQKVICYIVIESVAISHREIQDVKIHPQYIVEPAIKKQQMS